MQRDLESSLIEENLSATPSSSSSLSRVTKAGLALLGVAGVIIGASFLASNQVGSNNGVSQSIDVAGPLHAQCKLTWTFSNQSCSSVSAALLKAAQDQGKPDGWESKCVGEKCGYDLSGDSSSLKGTHTTPGKHYIDDLTFSLSQNGANCVVSGYSTSEVFYAVLDYSTNYCNLSNLGTKTALTYVEETSDSICTQYSSRNCDKY